MRIVAGYLGGRNFDSPKGHRTHPMSEKARGGLFSALGDIEGLTVLDAFAGSGALAFEAISRGVKYATAIDIDKSAITTIVNNAQKLVVEGKIKAIRANVSGWSDNNPDARFDLIFCDPPYENLQLNVVDKLSIHLENEGLLVLSCPGKMGKPELKGLESKHIKNYGDIQLIFYQKQIS